MKSSIDDITNSIDDLGSAISGIAEDITGALAPISADLARITWAADAVAKSATAKQKGRENMIEYLERFLTAFETAAAALAEIAAKPAAKPAVDPPPAADPPPAVKQELAPATDPSAPPDYEALAAAGERDLLLALCEQKGVEVPPRTKTPTLAKLLKTADAVERLAHGQEPEPGPEPLVESGPEPPVESDPFDKAPAPVVTEQEAANALRAVQKALGNGRVLDILQHFGAKMFFELSPEYYAEMVSMAEKAVADASA